MRWFVQIEAEVIVHNCDCHTYQQVIDLFCQNIPGMNSSKAFELAWRIDHHGSAEAADTVAQKLAGGGLRVEVR